MLSPNFSHFKFSFSFFTELMVFVMQIVESCNATNSTKAIDIFKFCDIFVLILSIFDWLINDQYTKVRLLCWSRLNLLQ